MSASLLMCSSSQPLRLSSLDNQKEIKVKTGDIVELAIDTQPSTGYTWKIEALSCVEKYGDSRIDSGKGTALGRVETEYMRFKAVKIGSGFIDLKYIRPWETDKNPAKQYKVYIDVEDK